MATEDALSEAPTSSAVAASASSSSSPGASSTNLRQPAPSARFQSSSTLSASSPSLAASPAEDNQSNQAQALADTFVRWFYDLVNTINTSGGAGFTEDTFWPDASAKIGLANQPGAGQAATPPEVMEVQGSGKEVCSVITGKYQK